MTTGNVIPLQKTSRFIIQALVCPVIVIFNIKYIFRIKGDNSPESRKP